MPEDKYPLINQPDLEMHSASGLDLDEITLENLAQLQAADIQVSAETLRAQAHIARQAGYTQLAANLLRAAELTAVPNAELLQMYDLLRPGRASYEQLTLLAQRLETIYSAPENARFVREAAEAYQERGLLRR